MTSSLLPNWPKAYSQTNASGWLKLHNADFVVDEIPLESPCGEGEHVWLHIEKNGANSAWIAGILAKFAQVRELDVGYAGMKDRNAITRQWFSLYMPRVQAPDFSQLNNAELTILQQTRHSRKLRRGDLLGNRFALIVRNVVGEQSAIEANLQLIKAQGVPNYFGEQRFGHDGNNIAHGRDMLTGLVRVRNAQKKGLYLSAIRSLLFNDVVALRISQNLWNQSVAGDILDAAGNVTAPLWGRGRLTSLDQALALESQVAQQHIELCNGMEHAGLNQERRAIVAKPDCFSWQWEHDDTGATHLHLSFALPAGCYATSVLRELVDTQEPERKLEVYSEPS